MIAPKHTAKSLILDLENGLRDGSIVPRRPSPSPLFDSVFGGPAKVIGAKSLIFQRRRDFGEMMEFHIGTSTVWLVLVLVLAIFGSTFTAVRLVPNIIEQLLRLTRALAR